MNTQFIYSYRCLEQNSKLYAIEVNLTNCEFVTDNDKLRKVLKKIYGALQQSFPNRAIVIRSLLVPAHNVSGASIMDLGDKHPLKPMTQQLCRVDFSRTLCSSNAILSLTELPNLVEAHFDGCTKLQLQELPKACNVQRLSLLDTKIHARSIKCMLETFPMLQRLRVTLYRTMHYPLGFKNWDAHSYPQVAIDGGNFTVMKDKLTIPLRKWNVEFCREKDGWKVVPLDVNNQPLIPFAPCYIHTHCSQLHSVEPIDAICKSCDRKVNEDTFRPFHQPFDARVDLERAFTPLPARPDPTTPWEIIERALEYQSNPLI